MLQHMLKYDLMNLSLLIIVHLNLSPLIMVWSSQLHECVNSFLAKDKVL